jgi:hypothetical protein
MSKKEIIVIENISRGAFVIRVENENKAQKGESKYKNFYLHPNRSKALPKHYAEELLKKYPKKLRDLSKITKQVADSRLEDNKKMYEDHIEKMKDKQEKDLKAKDTELERLKEEIKKKAEEIEKLKKNS